MKRFAILAVFVSAVAVFAQNAAPAPAASGPCLIVKHRGLFSKSVITGLFTPHARYDLVDSFSINGALMSYKGRDLELMQSSGVKVVVLQDKYSVEELNGARASCSAPKQ